MPIQSNWNTLEELREIAMAAGCTNAQFKEAIETVGNDPYAVAAYLQRYSIHWQDPAK
jgi:hypothetical protein